MDSAKKMFTTYYVIAAVILMNISSAGATQKCNPITFSMQSVAPCVLNWISRSNLSREVTFNPSLTSIVSRSLEKFNISVSAIDDALSHMLNDSFTLSKLVESGAILEPYAVYVIADVIKGFNLTNEDLDKLGLSRLLSNDSVLQNLYLTYFRLSCGNILQPITSCIRSWVQQNCDAKVDNPESVLKIVDDMLNYYCERNSTKLSLENFLHGSLGSVFAPVARYFGVYKDRASPFIFNVSASSVIFRIDKLEQLGMSFANNCGHMLTSFSIFERLGNESSTVGVGRVAERQKDFVKKMAVCVLTTWNQFDPSFFGNNSNFVDHIKFWAARFGIDELRWIPRSFSKGRQTAAIFGRSHIWAFNETKPVTCNTSQESSLLQSRFFTLTYLNTPVSGGSYISQITLNFIRSSNSSIYYMTGRGTISTTLIGKTDTVNIEILPKGVVRITDHVSGTVFVLTKFEESYLVFVRAGDEIQQTSLGSLANKCLQPINKWGAIAQAKGTLKRKCRRECSSAPNEVIASCVYDCIGSNNVKKVQYYARLVDLSLEAEAKDSFIASILY